MKSLSTVLVAVLGIVVGCGSDAGGENGNAAGSSNKVKKQVEKAKAPQPASPSRTDSSSPGAVSTSQPLMYSIADVAALPSCVKEREGQVAYVQATKELMNCTAGKWELATLALGAVTLPKIVTRVSEKESDDDCLWGSYEHVSGYDLNGNGVLDLPQEGGSAAKVCKQDEFDGDSGKVFRVWERRAANYSEVDTRVPSIADVYPFLYLTDVTLVSYFGGHITVAVSGFSFQNDFGNADAYVSPFSHQFIQVNEGETKVHSMKVSQFEDVFLEVETSVSKSSNPGGDWTPSFRARFKAGTQVGAWKDFSASLIEVQQ